MPRDAGKKGGGGLGRTGKPRSGKAPPKDMFIGSGKSGTRKARMSKGNGTPVKKKRRAAKK